MNTNNDPVHTFLMESHNICVQAQFIVDSLPNAELPAVERSTHQLQFGELLLQLMTPELRRMLLSPLEDFLANPPPPPGASLPKLFADSGELDFPVVVFADDLADSQITHVDHVPLLDTSYYVEVIHMPAALVELFVEESIAAMGRAQKGKGRIIILELTQAEVMYNRR
ncbi:hypothetical protein B0H13DRAFT_1898816 [Mycena leptocephala]|nr:hypothetical protein B0H13DRAFT_1898816 [Mycena leptocephala]